VIPAITGREDEQQVLAGQAKGRRKRFLTARNRQLLRRQLDADRGIRRRRPSFVRNVAALLGNDPIEVELVADAGGAAGRRPLSLTISPLRGEGMRERAGGAAGRRPLSITLSPLSGARG